MLKGPLVVGIVLREELDLAIDTTSVEPEVIAKKTSPMGEVFVKKNDHSWSVNPRQLSGMLIANGKKEFS